MTVLVDEAIWPWRGARWAHLVSDVSVAELHDFADRLGLRRMSFQGDHYDVPETVRAEALTLGAEAVRGRDLVRRLRGAGLRLASADRPGSWEEVARWEGDGSLPDVDGVIPDLLAGAFQMVVADVRSLRWWWRTMPVCPSRGCCQMVWNHVTVVIGWSSCSPWMVPGGDRSSDLPGGAGPGRIDGRLCR